MNFSSNLSRLFACALPVASILFAPDATFAVSIVKFDFTGAAGNEASLPPASQPSGATVSSMTRGSGLSASSAANAFSSSGWATDTSRDLNDYYSFAITADSGNMLALTGLDLDERRSGTGILQFSVYSSLDGFATALASFAVPDDTATRPQSVTLGSEFSAITGSVEFRIYGFESEASGGTWRIDNVELSGAISPILVSAPDVGSSFALLCFALSGLGVMVRRLVS